MQQSGGKGAKKGCACGVGGCFAFAVGIVALVGVVIYMTCTNVFAKMMGEETYPISGDPARFDPIKAIPEVTAKAGAGAVLTGLDIQSIRPDGTLDLKAKYSPSPSAEYTFVRKLDKAPEGKETPPVGAAGRGPDDVWIEEVRIKVSEPGRMHHVRSIGGGVSKEYNYTNEGMEVDRNAGMGKVDDPVQTNKPTVAEMWETAFKLDAPKDAVAAIDYEPDETTFTISGAKIYLKWDKDGKFTLEGLNEEQAEKLGIETPGMRMRREMEERRRGLDERIRNMQTGARG